MESLNAKLVQQLNQKNFLQEMIGKMLKAYLAGTLLVIQFAFSS